MKQDVEFPTKLGFTLSDASSFNLSGLDEYKVVLPNNFSDPQTVPQLHSTTQLHTRENNNLKKPDPHIQYVNSIVRQHVESNNSFQLRNLFWYMVNNHPNDRTSQSPLMMAVGNHNYELCKFLIQVGAQVNFTTLCSNEQNDLFPNSFQDSALTIAIKKTNLELCKLLIDNRACLNNNFYQKQYGKVMTCLDLAKKNMFNRDIIELLLQKGADPSKSNEKTQYNFQDLIPPDWNRYHQLQFSQLKRYCTLEIFTLCLKNNYSFIEFIVRQKVQFRKCIVSYINKQHNMLKYEMRLERLVQDEFQQVLQCSDFKVNLQDVNRVQDKLAQLSNKLTDIYFQEQVQRQSFGRKSKSNAIDSLSNFGVENTQQQSKK